MSYRAHSLILSLTEIQLTDHVVIISGRKALFPAELHHKLQSLRRAFAERLFLRALRAFAHRYRLYPDEFLQLFHHFISVSFEYLFQFRVHICLPFHDRTHLHELSPVPCRLGSACKQALLLPMPPLHVYVRVQTGAAAAGSSNCCTSFFRPLSFRIPLYYVSH